MGLLGYTGAGMEQGGGSISGITPQGKTEGRNVPNFLHGGVAGKAGSAPSVPMDVEPVVTQPGWFPVCPVPQDFGICGTALWAVQRHCFCFSQVLVSLLTFQFPSWTQVGLFGLISREALPATAEC